LNLRAGELERRGRKRRGRKRKQKKKGKVVLGAKADVRAAGEEDLVKGEEKKGGKRKGGGKDG